VKPDLIHWPKHWEMTVRGAEDHEGEAVRGLVSEMAEQYGWALPPCPWTRLKPFWYVAEVQGLILGAVQVCIGWPIGRLELLSVRRNLSHTQRAKVVKALCYHAFDAMKLDGTTLVSLLLPEQDEMFTRVVSRAGAKFTVRGKMYLFPLERS